MLLYGSTKKAKLVAGITLSSARKRSEAQVLLACVNAMENGGVILCSVISDDLKMDELEKLSALDQLLSDMTTAKPFRIPDDKTKAAKILTTTMAYMEAPPPRHTQWPPLPKKKIPLKLKANRARR